MKRFAATVLLAFTLTVISPVFAGWMSDISDNQYRALEYIAGCMTGKCPKAPKLKEAKGWQAKRARNECLTHMNIAYKLAKSGNADRITLPQFQYGPGQIGWGSRSN